MLTAWLLTTAFASPSTLPAGSGSLYGGVGLSAWTWGMSGNRRDPAGIVRIDSWAGAGLTDRIMLSAGLPVVHGRILDDVDGMPPCPNNDPTYCRPVTSLGDAHVLLHAGLPWRSLRMRAALGPRGDVWTAGTRTRYINVGQGTFGGIAEGSTGVEHAGHGAFVEGRYLLRFGRPVPGETFRAPGDAVQGQLAAFTTWRFVRLQASLLGHRQLRGVDYGADYLRRLYRTDERWGVVAFRQTRVEAKASVALSNRTGLHVTASRAVQTRNGPKDHTDVSIGMHLWLPPKE